MVGFILITHKGIGSEMLKAAKGIIKEELPIHCVEVDFTHPLPEFHKRIRQAIESNRDKQGVIILTDLHGATPSNLCNEFCEKGKVEMVTGCNLPMILKAATAKFENDISSIAEFLKNYGCENIRIFPRVH
jgi:mannose PTS system EIIA component